MRETIADTPGTRTPAPSPPPDRRDRRLEPREFARWLDARRDLLVERWLTELEARSPGSDPVARSLQTEFFQLLVSLLRDSLGPQREQVDVLWRQTAELYGNVGSMRGLAAGEVIEEFQVLRESLIRLLYADPPWGGRVRVSLREILGLNRFVDRGVTHSSIGHTDSLFFAHFQGTGVPERLTPGLVDEVREQLAGIRTEYEAVRLRLTASGD
jgi:hypothetical protein